MTENNEDSVYCISFHTVYISIKFNYRDNGMIHFKITNVNKKIKT